VVGERGRREGRGTLGRGKKGGKGKGGDKSLAMSCQDLGSTDLTPNGGITVLQDCVCVLIMYVDPAT